MIYVFDTSALSALFRNYYPRRFPTLWERFNALVQEERITSTREALREIEDSQIEALRNWAAENHDLFPAPSAVEGAFVAEIYAVPQFQQNVEQQKLLKGGKNADPFIIARARVERGTAVTMELARPNAAKIPNICRHFGIACMSLEEFMEAEGWEF